MLMASIVEYKNLRKEAHSMLNRNAQPADGSGTPAPGDASIGAEADH